LSHPVGLLLSYFRVRFLVNCVFRLRMSTIIRSAMKKSEVCLILSLFTGWCTKIVEYFIFWLNTMFITFEMQRILILCSNKTHISDLQRQNLYWITEKNSTSNYILFYFLFLLYFLCFIVSLCIVCMFYRLCCLE